MIFRRTLAAAALVAPLALAAPASAHTGDHPFANCTEAKEHGYSNIPLSDTEHYAPKLDRDKDNWGCDKHGTLTNDGKAKTGHYAEETASPSPSPSDTDEEALAETGGDGRTAYVASAGALLLVGGGYLALRRRTSR